MGNVISVENISKLYKLGEVGTGSMMHDFKNWVARKQGKEHVNPNAKLNMPTEHWALKDVSFNVAEGEVLGIIGKNGAGKSTLLKILSKVTAPTSGQVKIKGRIASLLEVGTGFHPDLSGRDNVYLNGAILGMSKAEVKSKFDQIVEFSGVEKFIDTPVKRYSSGMYVRLAFAVAAHLESEILIIDEVLAVGDAEFQKKCLGKMKDVSGQGKTVLFVSHNMQAIENLCSNAVLIINGKIDYQGEIHDAINQYLSVHGSSLLKKEWPIESAPGNDIAKITRLEIIPTIKNNEPITVNTALKVECDIVVFKENQTLSLSLHLFSVKGECIFNSGEYLPIKNRGKQTAVCHIPANLLNDGNYYISMMVVKDGSIALFNIEHGVSFDVVEKRENSAWHGKWLGYVRPKLDWTFQYSENF